MRSLEHSNCQCFVNISIKALHLNYLWHFKTQQLFFENTVPFWTLVLSYAQEHRVFTIKKINELFVQGYLNLHRWGSMKECGISLKSAASYVDQSWGKWCTAAVQAEQSEAEWIPIVRKLQLSNLAVPVVPLFIMEVSQKFAVQSCWYKSTELKKYYTVLYPVLQGSAHTGSTKKIKQVK